MYSLSRSFRATRTLVTSPPIKRGLTMAREGNARCGGLSYAARKPEGGFCFIPAMAILAAWFAYKRSIIRLVDLRVWLACFEVTARRYAALTGKRPRYSFDEVGVLVGGVKVLTVQQAIRRLEKAGLLKWSDSRITFNAHADGLFTLDNGFAECCAQVKNRQRKVPVPRRLLRLLAATSRPVVIATALGHLLRCLYYRKGTCRPDGRCKASWIANVFGVDERNVKKARRLLLDLQVLRRASDTQFAMNRWGRRFIVNLAWGSKNDSPRRIVANRSDLPPPMKNRNLSSRSEHQKLVRTGVSKATLRKPGLKHVVVDDLRSRDRLKVLFAESVTLGWCRSTEAQELDFFAAARRAMRVASRNPCGLFVSIVKERRWHYLSNEDEEGGRRMLRGLADVCGASDDVGCRSDETKTVKVARRSSNRSQVSGDRSVSCAKAAATDPHRARTWTLHDG